MDAFSVSPHGIPYLMTAVFSLITGISIMLREKPSWAHTAFFLLILTASGWLFCYMKVVSSPEETAAMFWSRMHATTVTSLPFMAFLFTLISVKRLRARALFAAVSFALTLFFVFSIWKTPWFIQKPYLYSWGYYPSYGPLSLAFLVYFFLVLFACISFFKSHEHGATSPVTRSRMRIFFWAFCIAYLASVDYLPMYGIPIYPFGYIPFLAGLLLMACGIVRYRLADITPSFAAEQIIKTMADALLVIDRENIVKVANEKANELFPHPGKTLAGMPVSCTGIPFFQEPNMKRLIEVASVQTHEVTFKRDTDSERTLELSVSVLRDKRGCGIAVICIAKDVTQRKEAERKLQERESRYRLLAENISDILWIINREFRFTYVSPSVERVRGYTPEEAMRQSLSETFSPASYPAAFKLFSEVFAGSLMAGNVFDARTIELEYQCAGGKTVPAEIKISCLKDENGRTDQILGISRDITERTIARQNLEISERHYRELIQSLPEPVITLDKQGRIRHMNRAAESLLGLAGEELAGRHIAQAGLISEDQMPQVLEEVTGLMLGKRCPELCVCMTRRNGQSLEASLMPRLIRRGHDQIDIEIHLRTREIRAA